MKLALNYSPQAVELLRDKVIEVDFLKCSDVPDLIQRAQEVKPVYIHFPLNAGKKDFSPDWEKIERMKTQTSTRYINIHLTATIEDYPDIPVTSYESDHQLRIIENAVKDIQELISRFGAENVIIENDPYHAEARPSLFILRAATEPYVIAEVIKQTGCGLLLDIDHARVSAHYMGISLEDYIAQLPADHLKELHMTGTRVNEQEGWLESHYEMREIDWPIFDWALDQIRSGSWAHPHIYTFEYGGIGEKFEVRSNKAIIAEQIPIFREKIKTV